MQSKKKLVVIDVQNDFVTGSLGTKEAQAMLPRLIEKVKAFDGEILMTRDTHEADYMETQEGRMLPVPHCIRGTEGWALVPELEAIRVEQNLKVYDKPCFGSLELVADMKAAYERGELESLELIGICTDICVVSNALMLKSTMPELPMYVDAECCAGVTPEKHEAALEVMRSCQVNVK